MPETFFQKLLSEKEKSIIKNMAWNVFDYAKQTLNRLSCGHVKNFYAQPYESIKTIIKKMGEIKK